MRDAIGGGLLLNLVVIFVTIIILVFSSILTYSKAFKIKNKIIEVIEKYEKYDDEIGVYLQPDLQKAGYAMANINQITSKCGDNLNKTDGFLYCVYKRDVTNGYVYEVVTYTQFNIPVVSAIFTWPVKGETKVLGKNYNY